MKNCKTCKHKTSRCPGCSRHCPMGAPKCKYGCKYFAKCNAVSADSERSSGKDRKNWKESLEKGGLIRLLLKNSKRIKKELKRARISEQQLLDRLNPGEKEMLETILQKLAKAEE